ncbi:MAG: hypothetical protein AAGH41_11470 [Pseudomonadota bacterium]
MIRLLACVAALGLSSQAMAANLQLKSLATGLDAVNAVDVNAGVDLAPGNTFNANISAGTVRGFGVSPYDVLGAGNFETLEFFSVGNTVDPSATTSATLNLARDSKIVEFLWGTPDLRRVTGPVNNSIEVFNDGISLGTLDLSDLMPAYDTSSGRPSILTRIVSDMVFDQVVFTTELNAFELANIDSTVPVPAGFFLMAGGLSALRLRKKRTA